MSTPDFNEYRAQVVRLRDLTVTSRQIAIAMMDEGHPAKATRKALYDAINNFQRAIDAIDTDLLGVSRADRQYEKDLS